MVHFKVNATLWHVKMFCNNAPRAWRCRSKRASLAPTCGITMQKVRGLIFDYVPTTSIPKKRRFLTEINVVISYQHSKFDLITDIV